MSKWKMVRLGDICLNTYNENPTIYDKEIVYIDISSIDGARKKITSYNKIMSKKAPSRARQKVIKGDILVSTVRPNLNAVAVVDTNVHDLIASTGFCVLRPDRKKIIDKYLLEYVKSPDFINSMTQQASGASYPAVSNGIVLNEYIPLPPLEMQQKIADVLDKAATLIELRKTQLSKLDLFVKSQFIEMFGDSVTILKRWTAYTLDECYEIVDGDRGKNYPKDFTDEGYCLFLSADNVTKTGFSFIKKQFITKEKDEQLRKGRLRRGDIVLTTRGTIGNLAYYDSTIPFEHMRINSGMVLLRSKKQIVPQYFLTYFTPEVFRDCKSGTAQPQMPISSMRRISIPLPPLDLQNQFAVFIQQVDKSKFDLQQSLAQLELNYQSLLQKCFRGEIF